MSKIITVFGATGQQGGSVARAILSHPELSKIYALRAVTRDTTKPAALKLKEQGAEVVKADMNDSASVAAAVKGATAVFAVTNFWEGMDGANEQKQGRAMADAAVAAGASQFIFSSLPHVIRVTDGKLKHVSHFDNKAEVEAYVRTLPIKSAFYWPAFYMQNFLDQMGPRPNGDGSWTLASIWNPDSKLPMVDISDTGKFVTPLLLNADAWNQKRIYGATAFYTPTELAATWTKVTGKKVSYHQIPDDVMKANLPGAIADELTENMILMREYKYFGPEGKGAEEELKDSVAAVGDKLTTFEEFVGKHSWFETK